MATSTAAAAAAAKSWDGLVLGTGHNALVLQAYLARAGLKVLSIDRASIPGGGLTTVENPRLPGFWHNTHSFFHRAVSASPWYNDLQLERHGAKYIEPELNVAMLLRDGRSIQWWTNFDRTYESFAAISRKDADKLKQWRDEFVPIFSQIIAPEGKAPPLPPDKRRELLQRSAAGRRLLEVSALAPVEWVTREFEHDAIRAGLLFFNGLREVDLRLKGFGHSIAALLAAPRMAQMCLGGSARLAEALIESIREHGGDVLADSPIQRILVRGGKAAGVELADGTRIETNGFIASDLNPQQTFLQLLDADAVPETVREQARNFRYNLLAPLFALNLALSESPRYAAAERDPELQQAFMIIMGLDRFEQFGQIVSAHERGEIPPTVMWGGCPTQFDPTQAPPGLHTAFMWEKLPYNLRGDARNWDSAKEEHGRQMLKVWSEYAPNLTEETVLDAFTRSPLDTERTLPNMKFGDLLVGSYDNGQLGYHRPFPGAGHYRTAVGGLYLCGGSTHPGGNITGLCGYNAARVIATDLSARVWWNPPDIEELLAKIS